MSSANEDATPGPAGEGSGSAPHGAAAPESDDGDAGSRKIVALRPLADDALDRACARFPMTDLGNAERFVHRHGQDFRFCAELGWFRWDGRRWLLLGEEPKQLPPEVMQAIFSTMRAIKNEAQLVRASGERSDPPPGLAGDALAAFEREQASKMDFVVDFKRNQAVMYSDKLAEWARSSEAAGKIAAAGALAKSMSALVAQVQDFDRERMAINVLNGTLRMERGRRKRPAAEVAAGKSEWHTPWVMKLHPHAREDFITKLADVEYREGAKSQIYEDFLAVVQPKPEMRRFLAQWGGLSMTGFTGEQKLAFFYGGGSNGKGTWVETIARIAGDYAGTVKIQSLLDQGKKSGDQATPAIAKLPGVRFLRVSEPSKGAVLDEGLVKELTGEDPVDARHLNKGFFTFFPDFKITISGNNKPVIKDTSDGIWRRMQLVPWEANIPPHLRDKALKDKLLAERDGIFAWLMRGLLDWKKHGLIEPEDVRLATSEYRDDSDTIGRFLRQTCEIGEDTRQRPMRVRKGELFELYTAWCHQTGAYEMAERAFSKEIAAKRFKEKHSNGAWWIGVQPTVALEAVKEGYWTAADEAEAAAAVDGAGTPYDDYPEGFD
ncbi:phage/plasmid primase, P4 family [Alteriqipengyuania sp.]|uniref:DNA primase family protein n=1 Tax=Alteriqipengyuania sp. TaxID=2800692 RepID=UPI0035162DDD